MRAGGDAANGPACHPRLPSGGSQGARQRQAAAPPRLRGRPPYGYRTSTADGPAGPVQLLVPDERTGHVVRRIFEEYLAGQGLQRIADGLTADGIVSPAAYVDGSAPQAAWSKGAVRAILVNPRYAGRLHQRSNPVDRSTCRPLVPAEVFEQVHRMFAARRIRTATGAVTRRYLLRSVVRCADCSRLMQGTWNNQEAYYRCRVPAEYVTATGNAHPRNVYLREQKVIGPLTGWLQSTCCPAALIRRTRAAGTAPPSAETMEATGRRLRMLPGATDELRSEIFRAFGLRLTYSGADSLLRLKVALGPDRFVVSGSLAL